jgi:hypothetical protein
MVKGEAMNEPTVYTYNESPHYSKTCICGVTIIGASEKGLQSLIKRHLDKGSIHSEWEKGIA